MVRATAIGAAIEGEKIQIRTRQFDTYPPKKHPHKGMMFSFRLGIRASASITEEYVTPADSVVYTTSMTSTGDEILGTSIAGWSRKPLNEPHLAKGSGTHSASHLQIFGGAYANVQIPPREHLEDAEIAAKNPPIQQAMREIKA
ncbi:hypothetical protein PO002_04930 [Cupriavidus necator]|uniref:hypothetical protein n=1 Tax=Cupriavidus necator TaxID=106590 RepID=UPI0039C24E7B